MSATLDALKALQQKLLNFDNLASPHRTLLYEGPLSLLALDEDNQLFAQDLYFFLFNDIVLYTKKKGENFKALGQMPIRELTVSPYDSDPSVFHIKNGDADYVLQAESPSAREKWIQEITITISQAMKNRVFGAPLKEYMESGREQGKEFPLFLQQAFDYIDKSALNLEGIFRVSGSVTELQAIKESINQGLPVDFNQLSDPHLVAGVLKSYLRELPEPLPTYPVVDSLLKSYHPEDPEGSLNEQAKIISSIPRYNLALFLRLFECLHSILANVEGNKMTALNLSIVLGPVILRQRDEECFVDKTCYDLVTSLILNYPSWSSKISNSVVS